MQQEPYILSPRAENDLAKIYAYISQDNLDARTSRSIKFYLWPDATVDSHC